MDVTIACSKAAGSIKVPPSKSLAHRYIICAALADGESHVSNVDFSEDIKATIDCIKALGAGVDIDGDTVRIQGIAAGDFAEKGLHNSDKIVDFMCRESGSTMRFFMGIAMLLGIKAAFYGSSTLRNRPFGIYEKICKEQEIVFVREEDYISVKGKLKSGEYVIAGNISSQFITGLMFVLPLLENDSVIKLIPPVESRSYIDLTIQALGYFGVEAVWEGDETLVLKGGQKYVAKDIAVEGDCSNAAFLEALNTVGGNVELKGLNPDSIQGDRVYDAVFKQLADTETDKFKAENAIDISDCPDLGPILFAVAAATGGGIFTGTRRLKIKESDRGTVMCKELSKFGIKSKMEENTITIYNNELCKPTEALDGHNDHRIVMSMAVLSTITGGYIKGAQAVRKSYPGFFEDIKALGIEVTTDGMDK